MGFIKTFLAILVFIILDKWIGDVLTVKSSLSSWVVSYLPGATGQV